jgi:hypothetical protein
MMNPLVPTFEAGRALLARNPSVAVFADPDTSTSAKLTVVPTMAFWVLAFGDAMAWIRSTSGHQPMDDLLRQHAEEDSEHWRWFVMDLESLARRGVGARSLGDAMLMQWGPANEPVRACAWTLHHLLRSHNDPVVRLAILEACEHGFEAFMNSIRPVIRASGQYDDLRYLGSIHDEAELGHALHELEDPFESVDWSSYDVAAIQGLVEEMYARLDDMHTRYAVAIAAAVAEA